MKGLSSFLTAVWLAQAAPLRVLFVGNSYTYVHDTPRQFQNIAQSLGDEVEIAASTIGGCTLYAQQASLDNTTAAFLEQDWDYIVLQDYSSLPTIKNARSQYLNPAVQDFLTRKKQAKVVLYLTWGYHAGAEHQCPSSDTGSCFPLGTLSEKTEPSCSNSSEYQDSVDTFECMGYSLARGYFAAKDLGADLVAPCGLAWQVVRNSSAIPTGCKAAVDAQYDAPSPLQLPLQVTGGSDPLLNLYIKDSNTTYDKHQNLAGCYLNALVFYATLFGKSPVGAAPPNASWGQRWGLPDVPLTDADLLLLQTAAEGTVQGCGAACGLETRTIV